MSVTLFGVISVILLKHIADAQIIRLVNGSRPSQGRLEVFYNNMWGTVCDDGFDSSEATVVCRMLGFTGNQFAPAALTSTTYGQGLDPIWLVFCNGRETSLLNCRVNSSGENCGHHEDVGVDCDFRPDIRLMNGTRPSQGRLEVFHNNAWGTVCANNFDSLEAIVVCRMLEFTGNLSAPAVLSSAYYGQGTGPIWLELHQVGCTGTESTLSSCITKRWGESNCRHSEDVGVDCSPSVSIIGNQLVSENNSLTLGCQLSTCFTSTCTYSWTSSKAIPGNTSQQYITLTNIKRDLNTAILYCHVAVNGLSSIFGSTTMNVQYGPSSATISVSSPLTLTENTSPPTAITCLSPVCNPSCNANWINGSTQILGTTLFSTPVSRYYAGSYTCYVSNAVGFSTKQLDLTVNYGPDAVDIRPQQSNIKVVEGQSVNVVCIIRSCFKDCNMKWKHSSGRTSPSQNVTSLQLFESAHTVYRQEAGSFVCTGTNIHTSKTANDTMTLDVLYVPILLEQTRTFNVSKGDPLTVTIQVYAFPAVQRTGIVINIGDRIMSNSDNITVNLKNGTGFVSFHNRNITSDIQTLSVVISATQEEHFHNCTVKFTNAVGTTTAHFEISPQGPPDIPVRFEQQSTTYHSVIFAVESGFFNGGDQTLVLQFRRLISNSLWANGSEAYVGKVKNVEVAMTVEDLSQVTDYEFRVYAFNVYGQSDYSAVVQVATALHLDMVIGSATGGAAGIFLIVVIVCFVRSRKKRGHSESNVFTEGSTASRNIYENTNTTEFAPSKVDDEEPYVNPGQTHGRQASMDRNRCVVAKHQSHDEDDYINMRLGTPHTIADDMRVENCMYGNTDLAQKSIDTEFEQGSINITLPHTSAKTPFAARYVKRVHIEEEDDNYLKMDAHRKPAEQMYENTQLTPGKNHIKEEERRQI